MFTKVCRNMNTKKRKIVFKLDTRPYLISHRFTPSVLCIHSYTQTFTVTFTPSLKLSVYKPSLLCLHNYIVQISWWQYYVLFRVSDWQLSYHFVTATGSSRCLIIVSKVTEYLPTLYPRRFTLPRSTCSDTSMAKFCHAESHSTNSF